MSRQSLIGVTVALALAGGVGPAAAADVGDGQLGCNIYEICFSRDDSNNTYQKHFYNAGSHDNYTFTNVNTGATNQGALKDGADKIANRDGSCDVRVVDDRGLYPDDVQTVPNNSGSVVWVSLDSSVDNENDRHERVNCA